MTPEQMREKIGPLRFLFVGSGETYFSKIILGVDAVSEASRAMYGDEPRAEEVEWLGVYIYDQDNWCHDHDLGPTEFKMDVGETDQIRLLRITQ